MEPQKFIRRPFSLEAVQVTPLNYKEVAAWCKGEAIETDYRMMGGVHKMGAVLLPKQGPKNNKNHTVLIGSWITKHRGQFRWWKPEQFESQFAPSAPTFRKNDLVKVLPDPDVKTWENWEGKVVDPMLIGVDFGIRGMVVFEPSQLTKIREMDSLQLEFNAGIEVDPEAQLKNTLDEMREASKDKIAQLEKENLAYDPNEIREGDFVKVVNKEPWNFNEHSKKFIGQFGDVIKMDELEYKVAFATADPDHPDVVTIAKNNLEKIIQNDPTIDEEEIPTYELQADGVTAVQIEDATVTINDLRERLGLDPIEKGDKPASAETIEYLDTLTADGKKVFAEVQKVGEADLQEALTETVGGKSLSMFDTPPPAHMTIHADGSVEQHVALDVAALGGTNSYTAPPVDDNPELKVGDLVETLVEHDFDGVTIPVGTNGRVVVIGVELPDHKEEGVEVMFADGHYHRFLSEAIAKV